MAFKQTLKRGQIIILLVVLFLGILFSMHIQEAYAKNVSAEVISIATIHSGNGSDRDVNFVYTKEGLLTQAKGKYYYDNDSWDYDEKGRFKYFNNDKVKKYGDSGEILTAGNRTFKYSYYGPGNCIEYYGSKITYYEGGNGDNVKKGWGSSFKYDGSNRLTEAKNPYDLKNSYRYSDITPSAADRQNNKITRIVRQEENSGDGWNKYIDMKYKQISVPENLVNRIEKQQRWIQNYFFLDPETITAIPLEVYGIDKIQTGMSGFRLGVDNNNFDNRFEDFYSKNSNRIGSDYFNILKARCSSDEQENTIMGLQTVTENSFASCYGMAATMALVYNKRYALNRFTASGTKNYYSSKKPIYDTKLRDTIGFYYLSQHVDRSKSGTKLAELRRERNDQYSSLSSSLRNYYYQVKKLSDAHKVGIVVFEWFDKASDDTENHKKDETDLEGYGHAILAVGAFDDMWQYDEVRHVIQLYDGDTRQFIYMVIPEDFSTFTIKVEDPAFLGGPTTDEDKGIKGIFRLELMDPGKIMALPYDNPLRVKSITKSVRKKKLKKKTKTVKPITVTTSKGKITYSVVDGSKKSRKALTLNKNGTITVAKKTKKGTYRLKVRITASGDEKNYLSGSRIMWVTVRVKK